MRSVFRCTAPILSIILLLAGCSTMGDGEVGALRQLFGALFSPATLSDEALTGFTSGKARELEEVKDARETLEAHGLPVQDADAVILPVAIRGEEAPRELLCAGKWADACREVAVNSEVQFSGKSNRDGRIVVSDLNWDRRP